MKILELVRSGSRNKFIGSHVVEEKILEKGEILILPNGETTSGGLVFKCDDLLPFVGGDYLVEIDGTNVEVLEWKETLKKTFKNGRAIQVLSREKIVVKTISAEKFFRVPSFQ